MPSRSQPKQPHTSKPAPPLAQQKRQKDKLARLPPNAKVSKRPLLRPPIASPYSSAQHEKVVYISSKTPFLSAVKRVEKLLHLADKRNVQSASALVQQSRTNNRLKTKTVTGKRKRGAVGVGAGGDAEGDEILDVAQTVESQKKVKGSGRADEGSSEEVKLKGTGKAIQKVLELALWFQQREEYVVTMKTGSVMGIDDISVEADEGEVVGKADEDAETAAEDGDVGMDATDANPDTPESNEKDGNKSKGENKALGSVKEDQEVAGTRIRYMSSLEVAVTLR